MELDDLKTTWQRLDRQLQQQNRLNLQRLRDTQLDKTRKSLRPLRWGHVLQIALGIVSIIFGVSIWTKNLSVTAYLVSGLIIHTYGIVLIVTGAQVLYRIKSLDFGAPVVDIQKQMLRIERTYVNAGWLVGLPWWLLWIPYSLGVASLGGFNLYAQAAASGWLGWSVGVCTIGMVATWMWYRKAQLSGDPEQVKKVNEAIAGNSLKNAKRHLKEIERFEHEQN